jgi:hypothetical protein
MSDDHTHTPTGPLPSQPPPAPTITGAHLARADRAWMARVTGMTWRQAADVAGYGSPEAAMKGVRTAYGVLPRIDREDLRHLWRDRLEVTWRQAIRDVMEQRPGAVTAAVRVAHAATALDGLNESVRVDLAVTDNLEKLMRELVAHEL